MVRLVTGCGWEWRIEHVGTGCSMDFGGASGEGLLGGSPCGGVTDVVGAKKIPRRVCDGRLHVATCLHGTRDPAVGFGVMMRRFSRSLRILATARVGQKFT